MFVLSQQWYIMFLLVYVGEICAVRANLHSGTFYYDGSRFYHGTQLDVSIIKDTLNFG